MAREIVLDSLQDLFPKLGVRRLDVCAEQEFKKRLKEIKFQIMRKDLHREDIRDLVELTTSRMDLYIIVGTLLLGFCIHWFTGNPMVNTKLPKWYRDLFLISNFCSIGYLVMAVWLAMHASIVSHSLGVRLLTSYARLPIPSRRELQDIKVKLVPSVYLTACAIRDRLLGSYNSKEESLKQLQGKWKDCRGHVLVEIAGEVLMVDDQQVPITNITRDSFQVQDRFGGGSAVFTDETIKWADSRIFLRWTDDTSFREQQAARPSWRGEDTFGNENVMSLQISANSAAEERQRDILEDDQTHFRRFSKHQMRWISYDAYARVCMSFGMNQLLMSLSYYVLGILWNESRPAATACTLGLVFLSYLVMRLDMSDPTNAGFDWYLCVYLLPPLITAALLWISDDRLWKELLAPEWVLDSVAGSRVLFSILATPVFLLHMGWLAYSAKYEMRSGDPEDPQTMLPKRLRTAQYLNVLDIVQKEAIAAEEKGVQTEKTVEIMPSERSPNDLPRKMVRHFTFCAATWWFIAAFVHCAVDWSDYRNSHPKAALELVQLGASWPSPSNHFWITSLHCNATDAFVGTHFSVVSAQRQRPSSTPSLYERLFINSGEMQILTNFAEAHEAEAVAVFHGDPASSKLLLIDGSWRLVHRREGVGKSVSEIVPVPPTWHSISAVWAGPCVQSQCNQAWIAGWDGSDVTVGTLERESGRWTFRSRFKVWPEPGRWCSDGFHGAGMCRKGEALYHHVRALQLGVNGSTLAILHGWDHHEANVSVSGSSVDGWDLLTGQPLGRWNLGASLYTAMCHDGEDMLLIRWTDKGPRLEGTHLPPAFMYRNTSAA